MIKRYVVLAVLGLATVLTALAVTTGRSEAGGKLETFVYVHSAGIPNQLVGYSWAKDGTLTELEGSPFPTGLAILGCGGLCQTLGYSEKRQALIAAGSNGLHVFLVEEDGSLTDGAGSPFIPVEPAIGFNGVAAVDRGKLTFVYANEYKTNSVHGFSLEEDGSLVALPGSPWPAGDGPDGILGTKKALFVMNESGGSISSYAIAKDGTLTEAPDSPVSFPTAFSWNLHPGRRARRVFVGENDGSRVFGFRYHGKTAALTALRASPVETPLADTGSGLSAPRNGHAVVIPSNEVNAAFLSVKVRKKGSLRPVGEPQLPVTGGCSGHGRSPDGKFLVVANGDGVFSIAVHKRTGVLTLADPHFGRLAAVNDLHVVRR